MSSEVGTSGMAPGDGLAEVDRGSAGAAAPATGSARIAIGMASLMLTLLCTVITVVTWTVNGVAVLGTVFLLVFIWAIGAHRMAFWAS